MRLLVISNYFFPEIGAAPYRIYKMAQGLSKSHDVEVICPLPNYPHGKIAKGFRGKLYKKELFEGIKVYRYFIYPSNSKNAVLRILSMFSFAVFLWLSIFHVRKKKKIDAVIVQNSPLLISFSSIVLYKKILGKKIVLNVSDLWPGSAKDLGYVKEGRFFNLLKKIESFNYRNSDVITGQSQEILNHIDEKKPETPKFLYRNIQPKSKITDVSKKENFSIVYAGIIGVAQKLYSIVENVDFKKLNLQFDIYGDGAEKEAILDLIKKEQITNISYKGMIPKAELNKVLPTYHFGLVPLATNIKGAVPSKIFDFVSNKIPVVYLGYGEAKHLVEDNNLGYTMPPKSYEELEKVLKEISEMNSADYKLLMNACEKTSQTILNFDKQLEDFNIFLRKNL